MVLEILTFVKMLTVNCQILDSLRILLIIITTVGL